METEINVMETRWKEVQEVATDRRAGVSWLKSCVQTEDESTVAETEAASSSAGEEEEEK